ncbi:MAG: type II secretion system F family protein [Acidimicrobiia bacterium]|nr:MAG: type II secretion system F family protein [Acidimicrobiia bacterium]
MFGVPIQVVAAAAMVVASIPVLGWAFSGTRSHTPLPLSAVEGYVDERQAVLRDGPLDRVIRPTLRAVARGVGRLSPASWTSALERRVILAGPNSGWTVERALAAKLVLGVGGVMLGIQGVGGGGTSGVLAGGLLAVGGYALPDVLLRSRGRERQKEIQKALPDVLDQLTISVEAGLGFDAALSRVAATGSGALADELRRLLGEIKVGVSRREALRHLSDRTDVQELRHFTVALQQAEQFGLPIARVLRVQSSELRVRRRQRAEEEALKIPVKIVFPLVLCIFPALFVVLLGPAMIRVVRTLL